MFDASEAGRVLVGSVETTVGELFNGRDKGVVKEIERNGKNIGQMHLKCEKVDKGVQKLIEFTMRTRDLDIGSCCFFGADSAHWKLFKIRRE